MRYLRLSIFWTWLLACGLIAGCVSLGPGIRQGAVLSAAPAEEEPAEAEPAPAEPEAEAAPEPEDPERARAEAALAEAEALYEQGDYSGALVRCVDIDRAYPNLPGLRQLRNTVLTASLEERTIDATAGADLSQGQMTVEAMEKATLPDTYLLERYIEGDTGSHLTPQGPLRKALEMPVSIHLKGANLGSFIDALSQDENINIIADQNLGQGKAVDIDVDAVPLREILDYLSRNFDVDFYLGEKIIWATAPAQADSAPLETRFYHLRHGLQFHGSDWAQPAEPGPGFSEIAALSGKATVLAEEQNYIFNLITNFVPQVEGAQLYLDPNTHALIARNTPQNLELLERLLEEVDVNPPQILIEARFVEVLVADLRDLGVEWILDSPLVVTRTGVDVNGETVSAPRSQIDSGVIFNTSPFRSDEDGTTDLGPQGVFGQVREGVPSLADQGLNMTYRGTLTDPMFQAILHALEISGKGRTLSVPRVTTINNNPAKLRNGEDLLFYEQFKSQAFQLLDDNNKRFTVSVLIPDGKPTLAELGITLVAVPSVGADMRTINLLLTPSLSELKGFINYQDTSPSNNVFNTVQQVVAKLPVIARREVQTKVVVESGETVVMGGLIDTVTQETDHGVPFVSSIPLLGKLFNRSTTTEEQRNLLIFVTATVLSERGETLRVKPPLGTIPP